ncbi:MAG: hypothetical protein K2P78_11790 [Gemmataceae bacterium]|nr:hypothetical protein [Gemmataceae bacterium]MBY0514580.1 hypothetical protein [Gemmataceae bacterium]
MDVKFGWEWAEAGGQKFIRVGGVDEHGEVAVEVCRVAVDDRTDETTCRLKAMSLTEALTVFHRLQVRPGGPDLLRELLRG